MNPKWLQWAKLLQSIAQNGLTFAQDPYDRDRYTQLQRIAAEIMSTQSGAEFPQLLDLLQQERGYATPKVDVRAAVFRHDEILLVREREDGRWSLPGGWADVGESPSQVAVREIMEESGYSARAVKLLAVLRSRPAGESGGALPRLQDLLAVRPPQRESQAQPGVQRGCLLPGGQASGTFHVASDRSGNRAHVCPHARPLAAGGL